MYHFYWPFTSHHLKCIIEIQNLQVINYIARKLHCGGVLLLCNTAQFASSRKMLISIQQMWKEWLIKYKIKLFSKSWPDVEPTSDLMWARRGAKCGLIRWAKLYWANVDFRHWTNEVDVDRQHCAHVVPTYPCYLGCWLFPEWSYMYVSGRLNLWLSNKAFRNLIQVIFAQTTENILWDSYFSWRCGLV